MSSSEKVRRLTLVQSALWVASALILISSLLSALALTSILNHHHQEHELASLLALSSIKGEDQSSILSDWFEKGSERGELLGAGSYLSPAHPLGESLSEPPLADSFPQGAQRDRALISVRSPNTTSPLLTWWSSRVIEISIPTRERSQYITLRGQPRLILHVRYPSPLSSVWLVIREQWYILVAQSLILGAYAHFLINRAIIRPLSDLSEAARATPRRGHQDHRSASLSQLSLESAPQEIYSLKQSLEYAVMELESDRKALSSAYQRLASQERRLTSDFLSAKLMHELGNPLASVMGLLEFLREDEQEESRLELLKLAHQELLRVRELSRRSLNTVTLGTERLNLSELVGWIELILRHHDRYGEVSVVTTGDLSLSTLIPMSVVQSALLNLALNSAEAQNAQGTLWLHVQLESLYESEWLGIYLSDQGSGVPPSMGEQLFEPWKSATEGGTGLGLAISRSSVEQNGGRLDHLPLHSIRRQMIQAAYEDSSRFNGACFVILCPLTAC